ncbi:MAG: baseplate J/gp47 family protein [Chloroflexi bacterium]|nr:baseplate J/gp47 family protein [Chloroflexota bacterium]
MALTPQDVIYLEEDDTLPSIKGKLERSRRENITLVAPKGMVALKNPLSLRLLQRHANFLGKKITLVSSDWRLRSMAKGEGFAVSSRLSRHLLTGLPERGGGMLSVVGLWMALIMGLGAAVGGGGYLILPMARVTLTPDSQMVTTSLTITATVATTGSLSHTIPAQVVQVLMEGTEGSEVGGKKQEPQKPAVGRVNLINRTEEAVTVPKGTQVSTSLGVIFATAADVVVPQGVSSWVKADIVALEPGSVGNVPALSITEIRDPLPARYLSVFNDAPTEGGEDVEVTYITDQDRERLRQKIVDILKAKGMEELRRSKPGQIVYPQTVRASILQETFDPPGEGPSPRLTLKARASVSALALGTEDMKIQVARSLADQTRLQLVDGTLKVAPQDVVAWGDDWIVLRVFGQGAVFPLLDIDKLKGRLAGLTREEAEEYLIKNLALAQPPVVKVEPPWAPGLPRFSWRIEVRIVPEG